MFEVVISEKGGAERREVFQASEVSVGRVRGNDLVLSKGNVSKRHARLTQKDGRFVVVDQNSTNGTYVNRQRIMQATIVREGDRIYIGDFVLRISGAQSASEEASGASSRAERETVERSTWAGPIADERSSMPAPRPALVPESESTRPPGTETATWHSAAPIDTVRVLVDRVIERVERRTLEREVTESVARRVERALLDELSKVREQGAIQPPLTEEQLLVAARAELVGLGPLEVLLRDTLVTQLTANGTQSVSVVRGDRLSYEALAFSSPESLERVLARLCRMSDATHDGRETLLSGRLRGGILWRAARERAAPEGIVMMLQRTLPVRCGLEDLVRDGAISRAMATFLNHCVQVRANVLVVGNRGSSVARVLTALAESVSHGQLVTLEEKSKLASAAMTAIRLDAATVVADPARLVDFAGSIADSHVVVENLVGRSLVAVVDLIARGTSGVFAGVSGTTVEHALSRLSTTLAAALPGMATQVARQVLASHFQVVVEVCATSDGRDRVRRLVELSQEASGEERLSELYTFVPERTAAGGTVEGTFAATGHQPQLVAELRSRGHEVDPGLFQRSPTG